MIKSTTSRYWHLSVAQADLTAGELGQLPQEDIDRMDAHMMRLEGMSMRLHDKLYQVEALLQSGQSVKELKLGDKRNRGSLFESMAFLEAMKSCFTGQVTDQLLSRLRGIFEKSRTALTSFILISVLAFAAVDLTSLTKISISPTSTGHISTNFFSLWCRTLKNSQSEVR
jgi:hypothetical protein